MLNDPPIYTIGYGNRTSDQFLQILRDNQITCLVDARTSPYSQYRGEFNRETLDLFLSKNGVRYVYLGDRIGGKPDWPECYVAGKVDYDKIRVREEFQRGIKQVVDAQEQGNRLALMCSEGKPEECHRSKLLGVVLTEHGLPVLHIDEEGNLQTQEEIIGRATGYQLSLFGEPSFTSRKKIKPKP